jgi:hypothetical protein
MATITGLDTEMVEDPEEAGGDPELPDFILNVRELW